MRGAVAYDDVTVAIRDGAAVDLDVSPRGADLLGCERVGAELCIRECAPQYDCDGHLFLLVGHLLWVRQVGLCDDFVVATPVWRGKQSECFRHLMWSKG